MGEKAKTASAKWVTPCMVAATVTMAAALAVCGIRLRSGASPRRDMTYLLPATSKPPVGKEVPPKVGPPPKPVEYPNRPAERAGKAGGPPRKEVGLPTRLEEFQNRLAKLIRLADDLARDKRAAAAQRDYELAEAMLLGREASILPGEEGEKALREIDAKMIALAEGPAREDLLRAAKAAHGERGSCFPGGAWNMRFVEDPEEDRNVRALMCDLALTKAREYKTGGKLDLAWLWCERAVEFQGDNKEAAAELRTLDVNWLQFGKLMADGEAAMKREQWGLARACYQRAQKIRDTVEAKAAIAEARYQENLARGKEALDQGQYDAALAYFKLAKRFKDTDEVRKLIGQMERSLAPPDPAKASPPTTSATTTRNLWSFTTTGDGFFALGKWAEALASYLKAEAIEKNDLLTAKVTECRFRIALAKADQLRAEQKDDEADNAYQEALAIKPSARYLFESRLAPPGGGRQYKKLMADGDAAMKREQWRAALAFYQQAQKIRNTALVRTLISWTEKRLATPDQAKASPTTTSAPTTRSHRPGR